MNYTVISLVNVPGGDLKDFVKKERSGAFSKVGGIFYTKIHSSGGDKCPRGFMYNVLHHLAHTHTQTATMSDTEQAHKD